MYEPIIFQTPVATNLSDHLLLAVLSLLWSEVADYGRNLAQYFGLFVMYITLGVKEKAQLLNLSVPAIFIQVRLRNRLITAGLEPVLTKLKYTEKFLRISK